MPTKTQIELLKLAKRSIAEEQYEIAEKYLIESNKVSSLVDTTKLLVELSLKMNKEDRAYQYIMELPDLFSDTETFLLYQNVLVINHYYIEQQQIINQINSNHEELVTSGDYLPLQKVINEYIVTPVDEKEAKDIRTNFLKLVISDKDLSKNDILLLHKLDKNSFLQTITYYLVNNTDHYQNKVVLFEELIKLGEESKIQIDVLGKREELVPKNNKLFSFSPVVISGVQIIAEEFSDDPIFLQQMTLEFWYCIQVLYPLENHYISNLNAFIYLLSSRLGKTTVKIGTQKADLADKKAMESLLAQVYRAN